MVGARLAAAIVRSLLFGLPRAEGSSGDHPAWRSGSKSWYNGLDLDLAPPPSDGGDGGVFAVGLSPGLTVLTAEPDSCLTVA